MSDLATADSRNAHAEHSHPECPVRHSYPLAISDARLTTALGLVMRTLPYALARFGVLLSFSVITMIWYALTFGGFALLSAKVAGVLGFAWLIGGFGIYGYVWHTAARYFLYMLKAGHIAVLTELITHGEIRGHDDGMFAYGKRVVTERFGQMNAMFALDLLVHGVVRAFNRTLDWIASLLPVPGLDGVTGVINAIVFAAATYIDETILSYALARGDTNVFRSSRDGLVYYAQNSKEVLKTGVWIVVLDKVSSVATWLAMLVPAIALTWMLPASIQGVGGFFTLLVAGLFAWNLRAAFLEPLFLTMVMVKFHVTARDQVINLEWDERLSRVSDKFVALKAKVFDAPKPADVAPAVAAG